MPRTRRAGYRSPHLRSRELIRLAEPRWRDQAFWYCVYCGHLGTTVDHFRPLVFGGTDAPANLVPACSKCNSNKADALPATWMDIVGVPAEQAKWLIGVTEDPNWRARPGLRIPRTTLDYSAYHAWKASWQPNQAPKGQLEGEKGELGGACPFIS